MKKILLLLLISLSSIPALSVDCWVSDLSLLLRENHAFRSSFRQKSIENPDLHLMDAYRVMHEASADVKKLEDIDEIVKTAKNLDEIKEIGYTEWINNQVRKAADDWLESLPTALKTELDNNAALKELFKNADPAKKVKLEESWQIAKKYDDQITSSRLQEITDDLGNVKNLDENGYHAWLKVKYPNKYLFEIKGYSYRADLKIINGEKEIVHFVSRGEQEFMTGFSNINADKQLYNAFDVPVSMQGHGISKAMYVRVLSDDVSSVLGEYMSTALPVNYNEFMKVYNKALNNKVEAALATPAAKALNKADEIISGKGWKPTNIDIEEGKKISIVWVRK